MMNLRIYKIIISQFLALILFAPIISMGQTSGATWNYPVRPGTEEWKQLSSFSERLNAFNIPDSILSTISTENLVKTCLNYPYWILIISRDNNQTGYDYLKSVFNGFRELENRKDAGKELLKVYQTIMPEDILTFSTLVEQGNFSYKITYIEILISQIKILENLNKSDLAILRQKALNVFNTKTSLKDKYALNNYSLTCLILSRILDINKSQKFYQIHDIFPDFKNYIKTGKTNDEKLLDKIIETTKNTI